MSRLHPALHKLVKTLKSNGLLLPLLKIHQGPTLQAVAANNLQMGFRF